MKLINGTAPNIYDYLNDYEYLDIQFDPTHSALWVYMDHKNIPCFSLALLKEIRDLQRGITQFFKLHCNDKSQPIHFLVYASKHPEVFNLGGDLSLFKQAVEKRDHESLLEYAKTCIDALYANIINLGLPLTTISLVQGSALGGGFEGALSCSVIIAEQQSLLGLPEVLFNLFPGMGAYSLLARRLNPAKAEKIILSGKNYIAEEMYEMGVIDMLVDTDQGDKAVKSYIRKHQKSMNTHNAIRKVRQRYHAISYGELLDIVKIWVDAAMELSDRDLRIMDRLVRAQERLKTSQQTINDKSIVMERQSTA